MSGYKQGAFSKQHTEKKNSGNSKCKTDFKKIAQGIILYLSPFLGIVSVSFLLGTINTETIISAIAVSLAWLIYDKVKKNNKGSETEGEKTSNVEKLTSQNKTIRKSLWQEYISAWKNYANFKGRAKRREYWGFILWNFIITISIAFIGGFTQALATREVAEVNLGFVLSRLYFLVALLPGLAVCARRLHDVGKSAWYMLISVVFSIMLVVFNMPNTTFYYWIPLLFWLCKESTKGNNKYGEYHKNNEGYI